MLIDIFYRAYRKLLYREIGPASAVHNSFTPAKSRTNGPSPYQVFQMGGIDFFYWYCELGDAYNRPWARFRSLWAADMPPSAKYARSNQVPGLFTIDDRSWAIFVAYTKKNLTLDEVGRTFGLPPYRVRRIVRQVESEIGRVGLAEHGLLEVESVIEHLGLPVRTRNALRAIGCQTIGDVLRLDLSAPVRGLGAKSKESLLERLSLEGFSHPGAEEQPVSEIRLLERSLDRIQRRVDWALGSVAREIAAVKQKLRRKVGTPNPAEPLP